MSLANRLGQWGQAQVASYSGETPFPEAFRLAKAVAQIRAQTDKPSYLLHSEAPFQTALVRLLDSGPQTLSAFDDLVLSHGLATPHSLLDDRAILQRPSLTQKLVDRWSDRGSNRMRVSVFRGAFYSYLQGEAAWRGLQILRQFLDSGWPNLTRLRVKPSWIETLGRHRRILSDDPVSRYAERCLDREYDEINDLREKVHIPISSWFWIQLFKRLSEAIKSEKDDGRVEEFVRPVFELGEGLLESRSDELLAALLERFATKSSRPKHQDLLTGAMEAWGSPQLGRSARWSQVSRAAKEMVCTWLAEEDLEDFHSLCQDHRTVDEERLEYWLRFKHQITYSQIAISNQLRLSRDPDVVSFRRRKSGRLAELIGAQHNNAIILKIGNWWIVEFSQSGNASYPYHDKEKPFQEGYSAYNIQDLKNLKAVHRSNSVRLIHRAEWQDQFDSFLAERGIRPDEYPGRARRVTFTQSSAHTDHQAKQKPTKRQHEPVIEADPTGQNATWQRLGIAPKHFSELNRLGAKVENKRAKGGRFWIMVLDPSKALREELQNLGFRHVPKFGFYRN